MNELSPSSALKSPCWKIKTRKPSLTAVKRTRPLTPNKKGLLIKRRPKSPHEWEPPKKVKPVPSFSQVILQKTKEKES